MKRRFYGGAKRAKPRTPREILDNSPFAGTGLRPSGRFAMYWDEYGSKVAAKGKFNYVTQDNGVFSNNQPAQLIITRQVESSLAQLGAQALYRNNPVHAPVVAQHGAPYRSVYEKALDQYGQIDFSGQVVNNLRLHHHHSPLVQFVLRNSQGQTIETNEVEEFFDELEQIDGLPSQAELDALLAETKPREELLEQAGMSFLAPELRKKQLSQVLNSGDFAGSDSLAKENMVEAPALKTASAVDAYNANASASEHGLDCIQQDGTTIYILKSFTDLFVFKELDEDDESTKQTVFLREGFGFEGHKNCKFFGHGLAQDQALALAKEYVLDTILTWGWWTQDGIVGTSTPAASPIGGYCPATDPSNAKGNRERKDWRPEAAEKVCYVWHPSVTRAQLAAEFDATLETWLGKALIYPGTHATLVTRKPFVLVKVALNSRNGYCFGWMNQVDSLKARPSRTGVGLHLSNDVIASNQLIHNDCYYIDKWVFDQRFFGDSADSFRVSENCFHAGPGSTRHVSWLVNGKVFVDDGFANVAYDIQVPDDFEQKTGMVIFSLERVYWGDKDYKVQPNMVCQAKFVDTLKVSSKLEQKIYSLLIENNLPYRFPEEVVKAADAFGDEVEPWDQSLRRDLRAVNFCTIDGADARDFDDAVYAEPYQSADFNGWRVLVAIADVSYYVKDLDTVDTEARARTTSIYFPGLVIPMLPESLSNGLCSLNPKVDRYTMVADMLVDAEGNLRSYNFYQAVINSKQRYTYDQVQQIIEANYQSQPEGCDPALNPLIATLHQVFKALFKARQARFALEIETAEPKFEFDEKGNVAGIKPLVRKDAHRMIEELMILANIAAANVVVQYDAAAPHRNHAPPDPLRVDILNTTLATVGKGVDMHNATVETFYRLIQELNEEGLSEILGTHVLRAMSRAEYGTESDGHFGLALLRYAQFTSPIRRYPDLLLHRAIKAVLFSRLPDQGRSQGAVPYDKQEMDSLCQHCNEVSVTVDGMNFSFLDWIKCVFLMYYLKNAPDGFRTKFTGLVSKGTPRGFFVSLPEFNIDGFLPTSWFLEPLEKISVYVEDIDEAKARISFSTNMPSKHSPIVQRLAKAFS